jgi:hypothetical protein
VGERFNDGNQDESSEIDIGDVDLISMCLEIASNQCITFLLESLDILEPANM